MNLELSNENDQVPKYDPSMRLHVPTDNDKKIDINQHGHIYLDVPPNSHSLFLKNCMVIRKRNLYFHRSSESDKVTLMWLSFTDALARRNGKAGGHLGCKTMANACQVSERVTRICKKANNCCLWRQLNPNHCWDVWTMR